MKLAASQLLAFRPAALLAAASLLAVVHPVSAHPGHGPLEHGLSHSLTSPYHLTIALLLGLVLLGLARVSRQPRLQRVLRWTGVGAIALSAVLWGLGSTVW